MPTSVDNSASQHIDIIMSKLLIHILLIVSVDVWTLSTGILTYCILSVYSDDNTSGLYFECRTLTYDGVISNCGTLTQKKKKKKKRIWTLLPQWPLMCSMSLKLALLKPSSSCPSPVKPDPALKNQDLVCCGWSLDSVVARLWAYYTGG